MGQYQPFATSKARDARSCVQPRLTLILLPLNSFCHPNGLSPREKKESYLHFISSTNFRKPSHFKLVCLVVNEDLEHALGVSEIGTYKIGTCAVCRISPLSGTDGLAPRVRDIYFLACCYLSLTSSRMTRAKGSHQC